MSKISKPRILVVDDEESMCQFLQIMLKKEGYDVRTAASVDQALTILNKEIFELIITDMAMPGRTGMDLLREAKTMSPDTAVIVITAYGTTENVIEAMKSGAYDYITKPFNNDAIKLTIQKCLKTMDLTRENLILKRQLQVEHRFGNLIGASEGMKEVYELIQIVRHNRSNVLITGESGTGKELVAREIHLDGDLAQKPFVTVNCAAIPETLMESELFGHVRGAFTGAVSNRIGLFKAADGGTIFLDEIGELPAQMQVKLLRVIQTKIIRPVGSSEDFPVHVRIIAATNQNLERAVQEGRFRDDLFFRLNVIQIRLPPLRERIEDIPTLTNFLIQKLAKEMNSGVLKISKEALEILQRYSFPGNIRELENILERSLALEKTQILLPESLPEYVQKAKGFGDKSKTGLGESPLRERLEEGLDLQNHLDAIEREILEKTLKITKGQKTEAAKLLKLSFRSFRYRLEKHGLE